MSGSISEGPESRGAFDAGKVRITPEIPEASEFEIDREPSLGKPTREVILDDNGNPIKAVWRFRVALGGKEHNIWVDGKNKRDTGELVLTFNISTGDMSKPEIERETAIATIKEMRGKFARMDKKAAHSFFDELVSNTQKIDIIRIKQDKKGPAVALCVVWRGPDNKFYALYHDHKTHQVFKKEFGPGQNISSIEAAVKEMHHTGSDVEGRTWMQWLRGQEEHEGSVLFRFDKQRHAGKHERFRPDERLRYGTPEERAEYAEQAREYEALKGYTKDTVQDRLSRTPYEDKSKKKETAKKEAPKDTPAQASGPTMAEPPPGRTSWEDAGASAARAAAIADETLHPRPEEKRT